MICCGVYSRQVYGPLRLFLITVVALAGSWVAHFEPVSDESSRFFVRGSTVRILGVCLGRYRFDGPLTDAPDEDHTEFKKICIGECRSTIDGIIFYSVQASAWLADRVVLQGGTGRITVSDIKRIAGAKTAYERVVDDPDRTPAPEPLWAIVGRWML